MRWVSATNITQALWRGDSFSPCLCSILWPKPRSHACSSTSNCAANIPFFVALGAWVGSSPQAFVGDSCHDGRVALGNPTWLCTRVALGDRLCKTSVPQVKCSYSNKSCTGSVPTDPSTPFNALPVPLLCVCRFTLFLLATFLTIFVPHFSFPPTDFLHFWAIIPQPLFFTSLVPFSLPSLAEQSLWGCRFCCVTLRKPRPEPMCTLILNLCRRWATLAGNPTVIVSRLGNPGHNAGLPRHEMASPCSSGGEPDLPRWHSPV